MIGIKYEFFSFGLSYWMDGIFFSEMGKIEDRSIFGEVWCECVLRESKREGFKIFFENVKDEIYNY